MMRIKLMNKRKKRTKFAYLVSGHMVAGIGKEDYCMLVVCKREINYCRRELQRKTVAYLSINKGSITLIYTTNFQAVSYHKNMDKEAAFIVS